MRKGEANSHQKQGWETFTDAVISHLASNHLSGNTVTDSSNNDSVATSGNSDGSNNSEERRRGLVFLLWGKPAQSKIPLILAAEKSSSSSSKHVVISSSHPSPLSALKTAEPFLTSKCFSRCNAALAEIHGMDEEKKLPRVFIDWSVPGVKT